MKKKGKPLTVDEEGATREKSIELIAQAYAESLFSQQKISLEPFDAYFYKAKQSLYADFENFRTRFSRGYRLILEELERQQSKHDTQ